MVLGALALAGPIAAQGPDSAGPVLSLADAQQIAKHNNPVYLQSVVLPQATANIFGQYSQSGTQIANGSLLGASSDYEQSQWQLNLTYTLNANALLSPSYNRALSAAAEADIGSASATLRNQVATSYVAVLTAVAQANLQDTLVADDEAQLALAQARVAAGAATPLDVQRAEVTLGQARVSAVQAHNQVDVTKLQLFQTLGVTQPKGVQVRDTFQVAPVEYSLDSLQAIARQSNPQLLALHAREHAADVDVTRQRGQYTPTLQIQTGLSGYTFTYTNFNGVLLGLEAQQARSYQLCTVAPGPNCPSSPTLSVAEQQALRSQNNGFPFGFVNNPRQVSATLSLPIFDGFLREQKIEQAAAARSDAQYNRRAQELALVANVTSAYLTLTTQAKTAALQQENAAKAREELQLAQARYQVGAASSLDVTDAVASFERAETDRINAVYSYQTAFAALEAAVGRTLR
jgi:outer membrane protein